MVFTITATLGTSVPQRKHAISVQLPKWKDMVGLGSNDPQTIRSLSNGSPRSFFHQDVQTLFRSCQKSFFPEKSSTNLVLFPDPGSADSCISYMASSNTHGSNAVPKQELSILCIEFRDGTESQCESPNPQLPLLYAVTFPEAAQPVAASFWRLTGMGISSRLAEKFLKNIGSMSRKELLTANVNVIPTAQLDYSPVYAHLRQRIVNMLERATINPYRSVPIGISDVFLFPSGMSAIYHVHHMLLKWRYSESIIMGAATTEEIDSLEQRLESQDPNGQKVQAIWCECASNPLLWTSDLERIRRIADKHDIPVVVDDTIGSFANVDVLDVADVVVTSLSKTFNGFADVLAGSAVLNPRSSYYHRMKGLFIDSYVNSLYIDDAVQLELNSRTFLQRTAIMNENADYLVGKIKKLMDSSTANGCSQDVKHDGELPDNIVDAIYYPKVSPSKKNYDERMRCPTDEFQPGYGCLFTIEFADVKTASSLFDHLNVYKGPSLGAHVTLAQPYVQTTFQRQKKWAASHGLRETIIRISVGLEDKRELWKTFQHAFRTAVSGAV
ncbi:pyridoxal phosphate-dependent transferase [Aspergillus arachidicola]|uniref:Pyridoxal phosphate-dependent transferase n=1 Tax=Aspergillus arachidicola TaxID=656916 RepID=A0A5N6XSH1_9EURO|nr:pyridoxal phosphate-dependent transferase [Aspergillus arachidicola]